MHRLIYGALVVAFLVSLPESNAMAGGRSSIETSDYYVVAGQELVLKERYFSRKEASQPPYYVYLLSDPTDYAPGIRDFGEATVVGSVRLLWPPAPGWSNRGMPHNPVLISSFSVPNLSPGKYVLDICNRPCTDKIELIGPAVIRVMPSEAVAQLYERQDAMQIRLTTLRYDELRPLERAHERLKERLNERVGDLRAAVAEARRQPEAPSQTPARVALALAILAMLISAFSVLWRRRTPELDWDLLLARQEDARISKPVSSRVSS